MAESIDSASLMQILRTQNAIIAVLDIREQEEFSRGHILRSSNAPLGRLEFTLPLLVPSKKVMTIFVDSGDECDDRARRACHVASEMGFECVRALQGGAGAWKFAEYELVCGTSCMAKGYAEELESGMKTPGITPREAHDMVISGKKVLLADIRDADEFRNMSLPDGVSTPGCELAYRILDLADPDTLVVTNCGARTRGILCAQMLKDFGLPNVATMRGGTVGWKLSGFELESGRTDRTGAPSFEALRFAHQKAMEMADKFSISFVDADTVHSWQREAEEKPLYIFDVRQPEEYAAWHMEGSRCTPGGCQLAQLSDDFAAVRNARFVLVDDTEIRAIITAYWLRQLAIPDVHVLRGGLGGSGITGNRWSSGPEPAPAIRCSFDRSVSVSGLHAMLKGSEAPLVITVGSSVTHRRGHVPGAVWVSRCWLCRARDAHPAAGVVVLVSDCPDHARLAAADAAKLWPRADVHYLDGNPDLWAAAGFDLEEGMPVALCAEDDVWYLPYKDPDVSGEVMEEFFDWKHGLAEQIRDGSYAYMLPKGE